MVGTPSGRQLRYREIRWEGSRTQSPDPRYTNSIRGRLVVGETASIFKAQNHLDNELYMEWVHRAKVTRLTLGDLSS